MLMKSICGVLLAASATLAQAAPARWDFSWGGFYDYMQNRFVDVLVRGSFEGVDADGNRILEKSELSSFRIGGYELLGCTTSAPATCGVSSFSFDFSADLRFTANHISYWANSPSDWYWSEVRYGTGGGVDYITRAQQYYDEWGLATTAQTVLTVAAVPEPNIYGMLAGGLLLMGLLAPRASWRAQRSKHLVSASGRCDQGFNLRGQ
ncbi:MULTISPECIES: hypothetical protein [unclassified Duganella]|uniref:hypothetical protein n=1 Tax=unclassified Duganella TaxID=2636909 RepID=UPI0006F23A28|nr:MULTISPECIES: hypothetical protein [unclassified Duganella]KQV47802.1 hypothetical protein ASD07_12845 [Duganella sp. Root336D2]KRB81912.1 hypothetical protein ASE26_13425 [Duganella sp. Root198D2]